MIKRDIIVDQAEQLGKVLAMIVAKFFTNKHTYDNLREAFSETNSLINDQISIDVDAVLSLKNEDFISYFEKVDISASELGKLADYLAEMGFYERAHLLAGWQTALEKALLLYEFVAVKTKTLSLETIDKENKIKALLEEDVGT